MKKARQHATVAHTGVSSHWSTSLHESIQWVKSYQHITFCFPGGPSTAPSFHHRLFFIIKLSNHGRPVIWGGFFQQCRFGSSRVAATHPLSALFGSRSSQNPFKTVFAITLCLSHEACVYTNINPMWKPQTKCKQFCSNVESGKKALWLYVRDHYELQIRSYNWVNIAGYVSYKKLILCAIKFS